jgi:hypothetical protein
LSVGAKLQDGLQNIRRVKTMYNQERKERFLIKSDYSEDKKEIITKLFDASSNYEEILNTDLCDMQENEKFHEVLNLLKSLNVKSKKTLLTVCLFFEDYINWCTSEAYRNNYSNPYEKRLVDNMINELLM